VVKGFHPSASLVQRWEWSMIQNYEPFADEGRKDKAQIEQCYLKVNAAVAAPFRRCLLTLAFYVAVNLASGEAVTVCDSYRESPS
jgi:hypothetical protein